jgi:hypothetical protein
MFTGQCREAPFHFAPDAPYCDTKDALSALDKIDNFVGRGTFVNAGAVAHESDLREVFDAPFTEVFNSSAYLLEGNSRIQESLDYFENQDVTEPVKPLGA